MHMFFMAFWISSVQFYSPHAMSNLSLSCDKLDGEGRLTMSASGNCEVRRRNLHFSSKHRTNVLPPNPQRDQFDCVIPLINAANLLASPVTDIDTAISGGTRREVRIFFSRIKGWMPPEKE